jgi:hypothetical protein
MFRPDGHHQVHVHLFCIPIHYVRNRSTLDIGVLGYIGIF